MNLSEFEDGVDRYGADLGRWPPNLREAAADLITTLAPARAVLAAMAQVESLLHSSPLRPGATVDAIAARAVRHHQLSPARHTVRRAAFAAAVVTTLLLGFTVGNVWPRYDGGPDRLMAAAVSAMEASDVE